MKAIYTFAGLFAFVVVLSFMLGAANAYFYPMKYEKEIRASCEEFSVSPALVASVANVESGFEPNAKSSRGALGIMQLMPTTASYLCGKLKEDFSEEKLLNPGFNIRLGTYYLSELISYYGNSENALLAYNAGQGTVNNWLRNEGKSKSETVKEIPYLETKNYLTKVNKNLYYYKNKYK